MTTPVIVEKANVIVSAAIPQAVDELLESYCAKQERTKSWVIAKLLISWANAQRKKNK
jgi:hypothetical protein